ncbi:MAG: hypothetical protein FWC24_02075 [Treponema sp.]|nr:hypothetical protein [Treponema sp.]
MEVAVNERPIPTGEGLTFEKVWAMFQESDRRMQETERFLKKIGKQMGYLNNRFGELAEHLVAPGIARRFNELGHHFDGIASGGYKISDSTGKVIAEVDLLLENGDCIMAVEVKVRPKQKDIERHIKRLEILRGHRSNKHDSRKIYGAIAGAIFGTAEKKDAIDAGFFVLEQSGDTMKMDIPDGFVPRAY